MLPRMTILRFEWRVGLSESRAGSRFCVYKKAGRVEEREESELGLSRFRPIISFTIDCDCVFRKILSCNRKAAVSSIDMKQQQAAAGFEPANNGFANRRLRPLGYAASFRLFMSLQSIDSFCNKISHITYPLPDFLGNILTAQSA
jgi:hypothetical protein